MQENPPKVVSKAAPAKASAVASKKGTDDSSESESDDDDSEDEVCEIFPWSIPCSCNCLSLCYVTSNQYYMKDQETFEQQSKCSTRINFVYSAPYSPSKKIKG